MPDETKDQTSSSDFDEKARTFLKAGYNVLQAKRDRISQEADKIKTGILTQPDGIDKYAGVLEDLNRVTHQIELLETIIRHL